MSFVCFIIPTIGRNTLHRTLNSLLGQTDPDWMALVVADYVPHLSLPVKDDRILLFHCPLKQGMGHFSGAVRNWGLTFGGGKWIGFVDDDDTLDPHYVEWLRAEADGCDLFIFRMRYHPLREDGVEVLPRPGSGVDKLDKGEVGISFAVRDEFKLDQDLWFTTEEFEDWVFIEHARAKGARLKLSDRIAYYVRH